MSGDMGQVATGVGTSAGAWGGAKLGAAIGTAIAPGIGTAIGGIVGSLGGAALGLFATDKLVNKQEEGNNGIVSELQALRREQKQGFSELAGNV
jgi:phage tail tape-measure protein